MPAYRNYDVIEAHISSRKRTLLRRALANLELSIEKMPDLYSDVYGITSDDTIKTHLRDIKSLKSQLNL